MYQQAIYQTVPASMERSANGSAAFDADNGAQASERITDARIHCIISSAGQHVTVRSEEHTSELQSLMRISYAVICLKINTHTRWIWMMNSSPITNYWYSH